MFQRPPCPTQRWLSWLKTLLQHPPAHFSQFCPRSVRKHDVRCVRVECCDSLTCERLRFRRTEHSQSSDSSSVDRCSRAREETEAGNRKAVLGKGRNQTICDWRLRFTITATCPSDVTCETAYPCVVVSQARHFVLLFCEGFVLMTLAQDQDRVCTLGLTYQCAPCADWTSLVLSLS